MPVKSVDLNMVMHPAALITLEIRYQCSITWLPHNQEQYDGIITMELSQILRRRLRVYQDCVECRAAVGPIVSHASFVDLNLALCDFETVSPQLANRISLFRCTQNDCGQLYCVFTSRQNIQQQIRIVAGVNASLNNLIVKLPKLKFDDDYNDIIFRYNRYYRNCRLANRPYC